MRNEHFFATLDFDEGTSIFQQVRLQTLSLTYQSLTFFALRSLG